MKVDISAFDSSQGSTKKRRLAIKGQRKKQPMSRQPLTKSPAIYNEVQKEEVFKGKTSSQLDHTKVEETEEANANCQGTNAKVSLYNSSLGAELPRVDQPPHGTSPNREAAGSLQQTVLPRAKTRPGQALSHLGAQHAKSPQPINAELERPGKSCSQDPGKTRRLAQPRKAECKRGEMRTATRMVRLAMAKAANTRDLRAARERKPGTNHSNFQKEMQKIGVEKVTVQNGEQKRSKE